MTSSFRPKRILENCTHNRILLFLTEPAHILLEACSFSHAAFFLADVCCFEYSTGNKEKPPCFGLHTVLS